MALLYIKCPSTGTNISTGMDTLEDIDVALLRGNSVDCHECGEIHIWDGSQAFFLQQE